MTSLCSTSYIFILLTTFETYAGQVVFRNPREHSCSSRADMTCTMCNGVPECFDLSDELNCLNMTFEFIPIQKATKACMDKACLKVFPGPPPLPPFSLCDKKKLTTAKTNTPTTTKPNTRLPFSQITTKSVTETPNSRITTISTPGTSYSRISTNPTTKRQHSKITTKPTTEITSSHITTKPRTRPTCKTTRKPITTKPPYRPTTQWWEMTTFDTPTLRTTTAVPPWTSTQWTSTLTPSLKRTFMQMWRSCASVYYTNRDIFSCTVNCYFRPCNRRRYLNCYNGCVPFLDNRRRVIAPSTAANMFQAVPTQLFPTSRNVNNWFGQNEFGGRISAHDMSYILMLSEIYNK